MALADNFIVCFEMNEASGNISDSVGSLTGVETSGTIDSSGGWRDFEAGDTEYFEVADAAAISAGDTDFTIEIWGNLETSAATSQAMLSKTNGSAWEYELFCSSSRFKWYVENGGSSATLTANTLGAPSTGTPYQFIVWHDSVNNQIGMACNAVDETPVSYSAGVADTAHSLFIGMESAGNNYFDGLMRRFRMWRRVLTSGERTQLYNSGTGMTYAEIIATGAAGQPTMRRWGGVPGLVGAGRRGRSW